MLQWTICFFSIYLSALRNIQQEYHQCCCGTKPNSEQDWLTNIALHCLHLAWENAVYINKKPGFLIICFQCEISLICLKCSFVSATMQLNSASYCGEFWGMHHSMNAHVKYSPNITILEDQATFLFYFYAISGVKKKT